MANHPRYNIVIDCEGDITKAYMLVDGIVVKTAMTKRNPKDKFSFRIAAEMAFSRLWAKKEKEKKPVFKVGDRVICHSDRTNSYIRESHGTIKAIHKDGFLGVEFDHRIGGHVLRPLYPAARDGHGWWCDAKTCRHESEVER